MRPSAFRCADSRSSPLQPICDVARFVEKPDAGTAEACWKGGGLSSTMVLAGTVSVFMELGRQALPALSEWLARLAAFAGTADEAWALRQAYTLAPHANFSRAVLEPCLANLAVSRLPVDVTWSDWGTPARVVQSLRAARSRPLWPVVCSRPAGPQTALRFVPKVLVPSLGAKRLCS